MAKAPSLGKYGVQRYVANRVPSERASCSLAVGRGKVGEMGSNMDECLWKPLKWKQRLHALRGEGPQVLRRMR
jgi:hypothetical protein